MRKSFNIFYMRLAGDLLTTCLRLAGDLLTTCLRLAYDLLATCWRLAYDLLATCLRLACDLLATCLRLAYVYRLQLFYGSPVNFLYLATRFKMPKILFQ